MANQTFKLMNEEVDVDESGQAVAVRPITTPTPTPVPTPSTTPAQRYSRNPFYTDQEQKSFDSAAGVLTTPVSEATIEASEASLIEKRRKEADEQIKAVESAFNAEIAREEEMGRGREAETNAANVAMGLMGSPDGYKQMDDTKKANAKVVDSIQKQKALAISSILSKVTDEARKEAQRRREEAIAQARGTVEALDMIRRSREEGQSEARKNFAALAEGGVDLDKLKLADPTRYSQLLEQSGYEPFMAELVYNAKKPKPKQIDYKEKIIGNKLFMYGLDPATGKVKTIEQELPFNIGEDYETKITDSGQLLFIPKNLDPNKPLDQQVKVYGGKGQFNKAPTGDGSGLPPQAYKFASDAKGKLIGAGLSQGDIDQIQKDLNQYGADAVMEGMPDNQKTVLKSILDNQTKEERQAAADAQNVFLSADYFKDMYGDQLGYSDDDRKAGKKIEDVAKEKGYKKKSGWLGEAGDVAAYQNALADGYMKRVQALRNAGYSDKEILKELMK